MNNIEFVYYLAYGSNLNFERFNYYILGGIYPLTNKNHKGCSDKNLYFNANEPLVHTANNLRLYFGNCSGSWGDKGVAFVEKLAGSKVLGRLYKVTKDQFYEIQKQESKSPHWYGRIIDEKVLGKKDGIPIWTITQEKQYKSKNAPSEKYLNVVINGFEETGYSEKEILIYLKEHINK